MGAGRDAVDGAATTVSVVVPVLDERPTLAELVDRIDSALRPLGTPYEIVVVDDGSRDGTFATLTELAASHPSLRAIRLRRNFGKSAALAAGFDAAQGRILVMIDGDLQDRPEEIPALLARLAAGADLVTGSKQSRQDPWTRRFASRVFNVLLSLLTGVRVRDVNSGLKAMREEVAAEVPRHGNFHRFLPLLAEARGFRVEEVDVVHEPRRHGRSRYGWSRYAEGLLDPVTILLLTKYRQRPLHFFGLVGGALTLFGGGLLTYLAVGWFFGQWIGNRPLLTLGVLCILIGMQSVFFGLLAELVVISSSRRDAGYSVAEVVGGAASSSDDR